jgi:adenine/guanine phosphoribosyltransferase-like PRPP-binding protein
LVQIRQQGELSPPVIKASAGPERGEDAVEATSVKTDGSLLDSKYFVIIVDDMLHRGQALRETLDL